MTIIKQKSIKKLLNNIENNTEEIKNNEYETYGWVKTMRLSSNKLGFMNINDGTNVNGLQIIISSENINIEVLDKKIKTGCFIKVAGNIVESPAKGQKYELIMKSYEIIGEVHEDYPLMKSRMNLDTLRNYIHLRPRTNVFGSIFRIRSSLTKLIHDYYYNNGFLHLDPNIITINECEGGAGVFQLTEKDMTLMCNLKTDKNGNYDWSNDHFTQPAYLTVSSQLHLEALACSMGNVYTMNKSFRSEHSSTSKHVSEFTHLEIEMLNNDFNELMNIGENSIKYCIENILKNNKEDIENLNKFISKGLLTRLESILNQKFIKKTYKEVVEEINNDIKSKKTSIKEYINYGDDLSSIHENYITEKYKNAVFVTHWPHSIKSFYMKQCNDDTCESFDLLMPFGIGELIGGSQREENYEKLINMMKRKNVDKDKLEFYTDLRKYGSVPHGGFGLGFDRLLMLITGINNIKDVIPFPVYYKSCKY